MANDLRLIGISCPQTAIPIQNGFRACEQCLEIPKGQRMRIMEIARRVNMRRTCVGNMAIPMDDEDLYLRILWRAQPDVLFQNHRVWPPWQLCQALHKGILLQPLLKRFLIKKVEMLSYG